jgi:mannose PTS system EIIA component
LSDLQKPQAPSEAPLVSVNTHVLLLAHAPLASAFGALALHAFPEAVPDLTAVDISANASAVEAHERLEAVLAGIKSPLLILVDVMGATPANTLLNVLRLRPDVPVVSGLNVAMLWRALGYRHEPPMKLAELASQGGLRGIRLKTSLHEPEVC